MASLNLLSNASATGESLLWLGGRGRLSGAGTFGGATVKLQVLGPDSTTWLDVDFAGISGSFTAPGQCIVSLDQCHVRMAVVGGTPSGLYANLGGIA